MHRRSRAASLSHWSANAGSDCRAPAARTASARRYRKNPSHTLSPLPAGADQVHAIVPVAEPISGRPCDPETQAVPYRTHAMLVEARGSGPTPAAVRSSTSSPSVEQRGFRGKGTTRRARRCRRSPRRSGRSPVAATGSRRSSACAPLAGGRMPPVLHVAFEKLARCRAQQMLADQRRLGVDQRHHVLQLVAKAERAARLIERRAAPQARRDHLVEQPAVGEGVQRRVGRSHLDRAERALPVRCTAWSAARAASTPRQRRTRSRASSAVLPAPRRKTIIAFQAGRQLERHAQRCARIERGADAPRQFRIGESLRAPPACRCGRGSRRDRRRRSRVACRRHRRTRAARKIGVEGIAREECPGFRIDFGHHLHQRLRALVAQHPVKVPGDRQSPRFDPSGCAESARRT